MALVQLKLIEWRTPLYKANPADSEWLSGGVNRTEIELNRPRELTNIDDPSPGLEPRVRHRSPSARRLHNRLRHSSQWRKETSEELGWRRSPLRRAERPVNRRKAVSPRQLAYNWHYFER